MRTLSLWIWYVIIVVIVWILFILPKVGELPLLSALLCATLFALIIGIVLLPYYESPTDTDLDKTSIKVFVVTTTIIPILIFILVIVSGEYNKYWRGGFRPNMEKELLLGEVSETDESSTNTE